MLQKFFATAISMAALSSIYSQDSTKSSPFKFSASADVYYRYNFNDPPKTATPLYNNLTSFTNSQSSFELGMVSVKGEHSIGKASMVADIGFGRRVEEFSYNDNPTKNGFVSLSNIKQLYLSYAVSDKFKLTMGKWATHVGYELVDAYLNRNYSMSYMFSYGPFFHTGLKADIGLGGKSALMIGIADPTDFTTTASTSKFVIGQFSTGSSNDKVKAYLNYQGGRVSPGMKLNQFDLVLTGAISDQFSIGYNGTVQSRKPGSESGDSWWGSALYFNVDPAPNYGLTLRTEYFHDEKSVVGVGTNVFETTLSGKFKISNLTIIPELRLDNASSAVFHKSGGSRTKNTSTALLAAVYNF
jgi:hypothetical protein